MKTAKEIRAVIAGRLADPRFPKSHGGTARTATVVENAPLALVQLAMEAEVNMLRWVLKDGE